LSPGVSVEEDVKEGEEDFVSDDDATHPSLKMSLMVLFVSN